MLSFKIVLKYQRNIAQKYERKFKNLNLGSTSLEAQDHSMGPSSRVFRELYGVWTSDINLFQRPAVHNHTRQ